VIFFGRHPSLWRGGLPPLGREAAPKAASASHSNGGKPPRHKSRFPSVAIVLSLFSLNACTVGPDFQKPQPRQITEWSKPSRSAASQAIAETMDEHWWDVFHDPKTLGPDSTRPDRQPRPETRQQPFATKPRRASGDHRQPLPEHRRHWQLRAETQQRRRLERSVGTHR